MSFNMKFAAQRYNDTKLTTHETFEQHNADTELV